nr:hypothetical protein [uncultured bacterium]
MSVLAAKTPEVGR